MKRIQLPLCKQDIITLRAGERVLLNGTLYTARDAAHKRLVELLRRGEEPPFPLHGAVLYYVGPTPAPEGRVIGSAGPTTSYRMDAYTPVLLQHGLRGMIGKGDRSAPVVQSMVENGAVYFAAVGGAAAQLARCVTACEVVAYEELMSEAVRRLTVQDFPVVVAIDARGNNLYETGPRQYRASKKDLAEQEHTPQK